MKIAVVGAGPAGAMAAYHFARDGAHVIVFDASHPREKPCGGGLTAKGVALLPPEPADDPLPARRVFNCRFESGMGDAVDVRSRHPVLVTSRRELDAWLLRRAMAAGAQHAAERVVHVDTRGTLRTSSGRTQRFDLVVGADGAGSLVRRSVVGALPSARLMMAGGWYVPGTSPMVMRFTPGLSGYLWLFPRRDHVAVGICAPLRSVPTRDLLARLDAEIGRDFPAFRADGLPRYAHTIPSPSADPRSLLDIAGSRWALVGDAAGLADPITGEGISFAMESAAVLAATLRTDGMPLRYPERVLESFGRSLVRAARLHDRVYTPGLIQTLIRHSGRSPTFRRLVGDALFGDAGYVDIVRRLALAAPRLLWEGLVSGPLSERTKRRAAPR
jgi:flavin-dependent dehydrogenase